MPTSPPYCPPVEEPHLKTDLIMPSRDILRELDPLVSAAEAIDLVASHLDELNSEVSVASIVAEMERMRQAMIAYNSRTGLSLCALSLLNVPIRRTGDVPYVALAAVAIHLGVADRPEQAERSDMLKLVAAGLGVQDLASVATVRHSRFRGRNNVPLTLTDLARRTREVAEVALGAFLATYEAPRREDYGT